MYREPTIEDRVEALERQFENQTNLSEQMTDLKKDMDKRVKKRDSMLREIVSTILQPIKTISYNGGNLFLFSLIVSVTVFLSIMAPIWTENARAKEEMKLEAAQTACESLGMTYMKHDYESVMCAKDGSVTTFNINHPEETQTVNY